MIAHNRRTYLAANIDSVRTHLNIEYCYAPIEEVYHQLFDEAVAEFNAKQKRKDRCVDNYFEKICKGKQKNLFYEVIFQVGNKDDMGTAGENAELATPHLHIDFVPFTTGSKRGLSTRVSLKQTLVDQGITGEGRSLTERDLWVQREKEPLAEIMLEQGINHVNYLSMYVRHSGSHAYELAEYARKQGVEITNTANCKRG